MSVRTYPERIINLNRVQETGSLNVDRTILGQRIKGVKDKANEVLDFSFSIVRSEMKQTAFLYHMFQVLGVLFKHMNPKPMGL